MFGALAQLGERGLCKPEVRGSIPLCSTINPSLSETASFFVCTARRGSNLRGRNSRVAVNDYASARFVEAGDEVSTA